MDAAPHDRAEEVAPGVARLLADNPSPFTFTGTQTYLIGTREVAVIDPGPDLEAHVEAILAATRGRRIAAILCTHTHRDHSPASRPLAAATGAPIVGCAPLAIDDEGPRADAAFDFDYRPDRVLGEGERLEGEGWALDAVATPGHTSNHLCFALAGTGILFTGDHVMGWSTTVVSPPDGDMTLYMESLDRLRVRDDRLYLPAHGPAVDNPQAHVRALVGHRRMREKQIIARLEAGEGRISAMVEAMYREVDPRLHPAAARSVLAHLIDLERRGLVRSEGEEWALAG
ncbi:MBL fold metallo-hydrolase [Sphingosinicella sp. CPCC 101087]|uniref:MBL fold metallo-hydrolase n=1 Tax=Sphingosinicella sp. CPCC 101087 TaxID=2497754 RepID=UPI00101D010A|nr:MBL fold metallo-hydrolase [Sphingosinicella sp. CPCC 101087]